VYWIVDFFKSLCYKYPDMGEMINQGKKPVCIEAAEGSIDKTGIFHSEFTINVFVFY